MFSAFYCGKLTIWSILSHFFQNILSTVLSMFCRYFPKITGLVLALNLSSSLKFLAFITSAFTYLIYILNLYFLEDPPENHLFVLINSFKWSRYFTELILEVGNKQVQQFILTLWDLETQNHLTWQN